MSFANKVDNLQIIHLDKQDGLICFSTRQARRKI